MQRARRATLAVIVASLAALATSCGSGRPNSPDAAAVTGPFEAYFTPVREIVLEEHGDSVLSGIGAFKERPEGGFLVADAHIPWLRIHNAQGKLVKILGRFGEGPGEFRAIVGAVETPWGIYASDNVLGRVTRFTPDLHYDTLFPVAGYPGPMDCCIGEELLLRMAGLASGNMLHLAGPDLEIAASFMTLDSLVTAVPYWASFSDAAMAILASQVVAADNFLYPLQLYDRSGQLIRRFGAPPRSWRTAPKLRFAELTGPGSATRAREWLESFTVIDRLDAYRDSLLLVTHAENTPTASDLFGRRHYAVDVYAADGRKLLEDIALPGPVVGAGRYVYVVLGEPPAAWRVGAYEVSPTHAGAP